jgi:hypothetical protein
MAVQGTADSFLLPFMSVIHQAIRGLRDSIVFNENSEFDQAGPQTYFRASIANIKLAFSIYL